jgi:5-methylcytosine-specific restriction endonuclease McrA
MRRTGDAVITDPRKIRSTHAWTVLAKQTIAQQPTCWLQLPGCTQRSTTADHVIPVSTRPDLALNPSNVRGACKKCNDRRQDTPISQLHKLRNCTPQQLDERAKKERAERRARRHIAAQRKPAPAAAFFNTPAIAHAAAIQPTR